MVTTRLPRAWSALALLGMCLALFSVIVSAPPATAGDEEVGTSTGDALWETNTLTVTVYGCPSTVDGSTALGDLFAACTTNPGSVGFTVYPAYGAQSLVTSGGTPNSASHNGLDFQDAYDAPDAGAGYPVPLEVGYPAGFVSSIVYCSHYETGSGTQVYGPTWFDVSGGTIQVAADAGHTIACDWFLVAAPTMEPAAEGEGEGEEASTTGTVRVIKYVCPAGTERIEDDYALSEHCTESADSVAFTIWDDPTITFSRTEWTSGSVPQAAEFPEIPLGGIVISETVPSGYGEPLVFCSDTPADGAGDYAPVTVVEGSRVYVEHRAAAEIDLTCIFFNFHGDEPVDTTDAGGTVRLAKYTCPAGYVPADDDYIMSEQCREEIAPVDFTISTDGGYNSTLTATAGVPQNVTFEDVPFGTIRIAETVPPGYGTPQFHCSDTPADGAGNYELAPAEADGSILVEHRADAGIDLACVVFNFEDAGEGGEGRDVHIVKYTCAEGVERTDDWYALGETCFEEIAPVEFTVTVPDAGYQQTLTADPGAPQSALFANVPFGTLYLEETVPSGFGWPLVFCSDTPADGAGNYTEVEPWPESGAFIREHRADAEIGLTCLVFNFHDGDEGGRDVHIVKYLCPAGTERTDDWYALGETCFEAFDGFEFTVTVPTAGYQLTQTTTGGTPQNTTFEDVPFGTLYLEETVPDGYAWPLVFCTDTPADGAGNYTQVDPWPESGAFIREYRADAEIDLRCIVFNFELDPEYSAIEIIKHTCPAGYDLDAAGADPYSDCPELTDGIDFTITGPEGSLESTTGNAGDGAVFFGGLGAGEYTLVESVPAGIASVFVTDCYGLVDGAVRPWPLSTGDTLHIELVGGELVTCHWFNVPDDDDTSLTVIKHTCATKAYESDVDCEIEEDGVEFDLVWWNGDAWEWVANGTTDGVGRLTFDDLAAGDYWLDEVEGEWCHIASDWLSDDGNWLDVNADEETVVHVYNCDGEPGKPGKTPTKYPDTGVAPGEGSPSDLPSIGATGLLGLALSRRRLLGAAAATLGAGQVRLALAQDQTIEPIPAAATPADLPTSLCLPPEPGDDPTACRRGPVPVSLQIAPIEVDAPIEILETIGGVMQQPSDETHVAWYKETARLGETGNLLLAGHLNWWGVPEAVFARLGELRPGDPVVLQDADGTAFTYTVEWVRQESNLAPPAEAVLGMTADEAVTLITCGGEWNAAISEYDARTVVRARRVPDNGTPVV